MKIYNNNLGKILPIGNIPANIERIYLGNYVRISKKKHVKVRDLFRLCYYQSIVDSSHISMKKRFEIYGELFFNHYELKQKISDEFEQNSNSITEQLKNNLLENIEQKLQDVSSDLKQKKPIMPNFESREDAEKLIVDRDISEFDLKKNDPNPKKYSSLLFPLINGQGEIKELYSFNDYKPYLKGFESLFEKSLLQGYLLNLLSEIIYEFNKQIQTKSKYQARRPASSKADACRDFISRGLDRGLTSDQAAYLITLQYIYKKVDEEKEWDENDKESLSSTIRAQKRKK